MFYFAQFHLTAPWYFPLQLTQYTAWVLSYLQHYHSPLDVYNWKPSGSLLWSQTEDRDPSVFYDPYYPLSKNAIAFWSGCQGKREGCPSGCYSEFQTEIGLLAFFRLAFSNNLTHTVLFFFLNFADILLRGTVSHWNPWQISPLQSVGCLNAGTLPPLHGSLWIISLLFPMVATPPNFYWQAGFM